MSADLIMAGPVPTNKEENNVISDTEYQFHALTYLVMIVVLVYCKTCEKRQFICLCVSREALVLGESETTAKDHFRTKLQEARRNAWSTSLNWYVHGLAKDNRQ